MDYMIGIWMAEMMPSTVIECLVLKFAVWKTHMFYVYPSNQVKRHSYAVNSYQLGHYYHHSCDVMAFLCRQGPTDHVSGALASQVGHDFLPMSPSASYNNFAILLSF